MDFADPETMKMSRSGLFFLAKTAAMPGSPALCFRYGSATTPSACLSSPWP